MSQKLTTRRSPSTQTTNWPERLFALTLRLRTSPTRALNRSRPVRSTLAAAVAAEAVRAALAEAAAAMTVKAIAAETALAAAAEEKAAVAGVNK